MVVSIAIVVMVVMYSNCNHIQYSTGIVMMVVLYSRGSEEGTQASGEERFQGQEEEEVEQNKQYLYEIPF